jgi:hypothetical protein
MPRHAQVGLCEAHHIKIFKSAAIGSTGQCLAFNFANGRIIVPAVSTAILDGVYLLTQDLDWGLL